MFSFGGARVGRKFSLSVLAVALAAGVVAPLSQAGPPAPVTPVDRLSVDRAEQTGSVTAPGGSASLTTTMQATTINPVVDIVFVLDTTDSMTSKIATMQQGLTAFVKNITDAGGKDLAFGVYVFGDLGSNDKFLWTKTLTPQSGLNLNQLFMGLPGNQGGDWPEDAI